MEHQKGVKGQPGTSGTESYTFQGLVVFKVETDAWQTLKTLHRHQTVKFRASYKKTMLFTLAAIGFN